MINVFCTTTVTTTTVKLPLLRKKWKLICNICRKITPYIINNINVRFWALREFFLSGKKKKKKLVLDFCKNQTLKNKKQLLKNWWDLLAKRKDFQLYVE